MSAVTSAVTTCPNFQDMLNNYFVTCQRVRLGSPAFQFLLSPQNQMGVRQLVNPTPNKLKTVTLVYDQAINTTEATDVTDCDKICTATTDRGDLSKDYYIDCTDGKYVEGRIRTSDWNESCRNNGEVIFSRLNLLMGALDDAMAQKTAQELNPLVGDWSDDVAASGLTIDGDGFLEVATKKSGGDPDLQAYQEIDLAIMQTGYCNGTFIAGGSQLYQYNRIMDVSCCADNGIDGAEMMAAYGKSVVWDRWIANAFGDDVSLVFQPGSVQLLTYNDTDPRITDDFGGLADIDMTYRNFWEGIVISPATGLPMDLTLKNDCGVIHMVLKATTKAVGLPIDMYAPGHPLENVTYLNGIAVTNP